MKQKEKNIFLFEKGFVGSYVAMMERKRIILEPPE